MGTKTSIIVPYRSLIVTLIYRPPLKEPYSPNIDLGFRPGFPGSKCLHLGSGAGSGSGFDCEGGSGTRTRQGEP